METGLDLLLSNENVRSWLLRRLTSGDHPACTDPPNTCCRSSAYPRARRRQASACTLFAATWRLLAIVIVVVTGATCMAAHHKVVSVYLASFRRLHQFVRFLWTAAATTIVLMTIRSGPSTTNWCFLQQVVPAAIAIELAFEIDEVALVVAILDVLLLLPLVLPEDGIDRLLLRERRRASTSASSSRRSIGRRGTGHPGCIDCQWRLLLLHLLRLMRH